MIRRRGCANITTVSIIISFMILICYNILQYSDFYSHAAKKIIQETRPNISNNMMLRKQYLQEKCLENKEFFLRDSKMKALHYNSEFGQPFLWCRVPKASSSSWVKFFTDMYYKDLKPYHGCLREGGHKTIHIEWNSKLMTGYFFFQYNMSKNILNILQKIGKAQIFA